MKNEKNNFGFIAASSICIFILLIMIVGNFGGKGTRAASANCSDYSCNSGGTISDDGTNCYCTYSTSSANLSSCNSLSIGTSYQYGGKTCSISSTPTNTTDENTGVVNGCKFDVKCNVGAVSAPSSSSLSSSSASSPSSNSKQTIDAPSACNSISYDSSKSEYKFSSENLVGFKADKMNASTCTVTADNIKNGISSCTIRVGVEVNYQFSGDSPLSALVKCSVTNLPNDLSNILSKPTCINRVYTGEPQTILEVPAGANYTISGYTSGVVKETNAGDYNLTLVANSGYSWEAGSSKSNTTITCKISQREVATLNLESSGIVTGLNLTNTFKYNFEPYPGNPCSENVTISASSNNSGAFNSINLDTTKKQVSFSLKELEEGKTANITVTATPKDTKNCKAVSRTFTVQYSTDSTKPYCRYCSNDRVYSWVTDLTTPLPANCSVVAGVDSKEGCGACYYCPSDVTDDNSASSAYRGKYYWSTQHPSNTTIKCTYKEDLRTEHQGGSAWVLADGVSAADCKGNAPVSGGSSSNNGGNGGNNGGDNGGIGGGDDTGNNNGGNNNATNNPQTGSALIFVVWSIGIAMVVYAFWYFKTSKEY